MKLIKIEDLDEQLKTLSKIEEIEEIDKEIIKNSLKYFNGNKTQVAKTLKITIKTLYNKIHDYNIEN